MYEDDLRAIAYVMRDCGVSGDRGDSIALIHDLAGMMGNRVRQAVHACKLKPPAVSNACATCNNVASSKCFPNSCMPTGSGGSLFDASPWVRPHGTEIPGMPARSAVTV